MSKKTINIIIILFLIWRIFIGFFMAVSPQILPYEPSFPADKDMQRILDVLPLNLRVVFGFDGTHYLDIAQHGYKQTALIQAFFPTFPLINSAVSVLTFLSLPTKVNIFLIIINSLALILFFVIYNYLNKINLSITNIKWFFLFFLLFPTSFFLICFYSESLFLIFLFLSFLFYYQKKWRLLFISILILTSIRITGIIIIPTLIIAYLIDSSDLTKSGKVNFEKFKGKDFYLPLLPIILGSAGLIFYMIYLQINFSQPLMFLDVQAQFGASRQSSFVLWPQVIWRYLKIFHEFYLSGQLFNNWKSYIYLQEFILSNLALIIILWQLFTHQTWQVFLHNADQKLAKKSHFFSHSLHQITSYLQNHQQNIPLETIIFSLGACLMPPLTGNFSSMPRYLLLCPSIFIFLSQIKSRLIKIIIISIFTLLLIINLILFSQGYWVA